MKTHLRPLIHSLLALGIIALPTAAAHANERIDERLTRIERIIDSGALAEMVNQMEQLRRELQLVRGDLEVAQHELEQLKQRQRDLYQDNDRRLRQLETAQQSAPQPDTSDGVPAVPVPDLDGDNQTLTLGAGAATSGSAMSDWDEYQAAFAILRAGRYAEAREAMRAFLDNHPEGRFRDNALYWMGETHYVVREYRQALPHFQRVVDELPQSGKHPDALLKIGFIHHELGEPDRARETLEQVQRDFPDSTAATLAAQRLQRLRQQDR